MVLIYTITRASYLIHSIKANSESIASVITEIDFQHRKKWHIAKVISLAILSENPQESIVNPQSSKEN